MNDDDVLALTDEGRAALAESRLGSELAAARVAAALACLPGWDWEPGDLDDVARTAVAALDGR